MNVLKTISIALFITMFAVRHAPAPTPKPPKIDYKATVVNQTAATLSVDGSVYMPSHGWVHYNKRNLSPGVGVQYALSAVEDNSGTYAQYKYQAPETGTWKTIKQGVADMKPSKTIYIRNY